MTDTTRDIAVTMRREVIPEGAKRLGLVIGIDRYQDTRLNLRCARADAEAMRNLMLDPECGLFDAENVTLLADEDATRERIWRALAGLRRKAHKQDSVWIFYAGHGAPEGEDFYWVPHDGDVDDLYSTGLSRRDLNGVLDDLHAERIVAFMDCCHAAAIAAQKHKTRAVMTAEAAFAGYTGKGRVILSASDGQEKSVELADKGHGAFTWFLTQGLKGSADKEGSGIVHLDALWCYLQDKVTDASRQAGNQQNPVLLGEHSHKLPLTLNPLITGQKRAMAEKLRSLTGIEEDDLTTEETRFCMQLLRDGPANQPEKDVYDEFWALLQNGPRMGTFKRLIQSAMAAPRPAQPPHVVPAPVQKKEPAAAQLELERVNQIKTSGSIEQIRKRFAIDSEQAVSLIDAWSLENPQYLNPLSAHAECVRCDNTELYRIEITALSESRTSDVEQEPFAGDPAAVECASASDKWEKEFAIPNQFEAATETWRDPKPNRILTCDGCGGKGETKCSTCHGTGEWICDKCQGVGSVMCNECSGTGKDHRRQCNDDAGCSKVGNGTFSQKRKCLKCHGAKTLPCTACTGQPKRTCPTCGGQKKVTCVTCASAGRLAEYDVVELIWSVERSAKWFTEATGLLTKPDEKTADGMGAMPILTWTTEKKALPESLDPLPPNIVWQLRQYWNATLPALKGKVHRIKLEVGWIPCTLCRMRHKTVLFDVQILGEQHDITVSAGVPKDNAYLKEKEIRSLQEKIVECNEMLSKKKVIMTAWGVGLLVGLLFAGLGVFDLRSASDPLASALLAAIMFGAIGALVALVFLLIEMFKKDGWLELKAGLNRIEEQLRLMKAQDGENSGSVLDAGE